ncbi:DUF2382 domain-containing protein [Blastococcus sp. TF02A-26]|uniref:DUF2382 domain-containing protein n=1 Tax=Blastococcus sp. TF02A-26 TaxID=2250577 RepID=UPI001314EFB6|nr:DUF2382 domain-containing protein [Blastococcus sp. TF02A-26]
MVTENLPHAVDVVRFEERLRTERERVPVERVVVGKRVITETRTVTVEVRREEFFIERSCVPGGSGAGTERSNGWDIICYEEIPEVSLRLTPVERVRVRVEPVAETADVTAAVRVEQVAIEQETR